MTAVNRFHAITDKCKRRLQNQIGDIVLVGSNDLNHNAYKCCFCNYLAIDHRIANCDHVFCKNCYFKHYTELCPVCKTKVVKNHQDSEFQDAVLQLNVYCKFKEIGCVATFALGDFLQHERVCEHSTKKPRTSAKKGRSTSTVKAIQQLTENVQEITEAIKLMQEENRRQKPEMKDITEKQMDMCASAEADQANQQKIQHDLHEIKISLKKLADPEIKSKNEITIIEEEIRQLKETTCDRMLQLESKQETYEAEFEKLRDKLHAGDFSCGPPSIFLWKIADFEKKLMNLKKKNVPIKCEKLFSVSDALKFRPKLLRDRGKNYLFLNLELTDKGNGSFPFLHARRYVLLDQSDSKDKVDVELFDRPTFRMNSAKEMLGESFYVSPFCSFSFLEDRLSNFLKNDAVIIKVILEPISFLYKQLASNDGVLLWRIDNYSKNKRLAMQEVRKALISKPFKSSEMGYNMYVELHLNGNSSGIGEFISIYIRFILGEWDENLECPFECKFSCQLMDQSESGITNHLGKETKFVFDEKKCIRGFSRFVLQSEAESPCYLKNDSILVKTVVQIL